MVKRKSYYCPKCDERCKDIRYPLVKYNDGTFKCGFCKFSVSKDAIKELTTAYT